MSITTTDALQYIRMTQKQYNIADLPISVNKNLGRKNVTWGQYKSWHDGAYDPRNCIELSELILCSFDLFRHVFLHELAHALDHRERGTLRKNGRMNAHGANFNRWCKRLGIQKGAYIPDRLMPCADTLKIMGAK